MDVIEEIYRKSIQPSEQHMRCDKKYKNAKNKVNQYYHLLSERLTEDEQGLLNKLMSCYDAKTERKNVHCFTSGFKKGLEVAVNSLK